MVQHLMKMPPSHMSVEAFQSGPTGRPRADQGQTGLYISPGPGMPLDPPGGTGGNGKGASGLLCLAC